MPRSPQDAPAPASQPQDAQADTRPPNEAPADVGLLQDAPADARQSNDASADASRAQDVPAGASQTQGAPADTRQPHNAPADASQPQDAPVDGGAAQDALDDSLDVQRSTRPALPALTGSVGQSGIGIDPSRVRVQNMSKDFSRELQLLIASGDYGSKFYKLARVYKKIPESRDRYSFDPFSWKQFVDSKSPAMLFRGACNDVAGFRGLERLPLDSHHIQEALGTSSILDGIYEAVQAEWDGGRPCPPDQCSVELSRYYSKLNFEADEAYVYKSEYWLQARNRESPVHVDHGRVVSYIPPCASSCFKIWVFFPVKRTEVFNVGNKDDSFNRMLESTTAGVLVQRPGDVVCINNLVYHSVLLAYLPRTAEVDKWGGIFGDVIVRQEDRIDSFRYATSLASGSKRGSRRAWQSLLSAYCTMEGRAWDPSKYDEEKERFLSTLPLSEASSKMQAVANAKWNKKRKLQEKMRKVREGKKSK